LFKSRIAVDFDILVHGNRECNYLIPNLKENIGFEIYINGIYEQETIDFILTRLSGTGGVFLDIGANIGAITIPVCKQLENLQVICVEAAPWVSKYLKHNIQLNELKNVQVLDNAISDRDGDSVMFYSPHEKFGKGSMAPVFTEEGTTVKTTTIDAIALSLNARVRLIKIDVEGFEYKAFCGGAEVLKNKDAPDILFEFVDWAEELAGMNPGSAQQLLLSYGYSLFIMQNKKLRKTTKPETKGSFMFFATKEEQFKRKVKVFAVSQGLIKKIFY